MSYIVKQKIKGNIYLYSVDSYWDKEKKQSRQKRTYIGPENKKKPNKRTNNKEIIYKKYGNIYLLQKIAEDLGLKKILSEVFPNNFNEILALAFFSICGSDPMYMFPHWLHEQYNIETRLLHSAEISELSEMIGVSQVGVRDFFSSWINSQKVCSEVYYDITSISSYATNIDFIEWGYNRDKERLPQENIGLVCRENGTPLCYQIYPGSITDVTTLKNSLKLFGYYNLHDITLILDRGFCSKANIMEMNSLGDKIKFIQPMTFSMKKVLHLLKTNRKELKKTESAFKFDEEILHYAKDALDIEGSTYKAHMYYNEKAEADLRNDFMIRLLSIKDKLPDRKFISMKEYLDFRNSSIPEKYLTFFKLNKSTGCIELNYRNIRQYMIKSGYFILLSNSEKLEKINTLEYYRNRDTVEKLFNIEKNELDGNRLRVHSQYSSDGRIFIKFIALILYNKISCIMKKKKLFERYSLKEMMAELSKIRCTEIEGKKMVSEISKTQRAILKAFELSSEML
jgi:transposase